MYENPERIQQFKADVAAMKLRDPATSTDRLLSRLGVVGMLAGPSFAVAAWFIAHGTRNPLQQRDAIVLGLLGLTVALVGTGLWLKSALAGFLRFWMTRLAYEQASRDDRLAADHTSGEVSADLAPEPAEVRTLPAGARDAVEPEDDAKLHVEATDGEKADEETSEVSPS